MKRLSVLLLKILDARKYLKSYQFPYFYVVRTSKGANILSVTGGVRIIIFLFLCISYVKNCKDKSERCRNCKARKLCVPGDVRKNET
jgi:hypothetical protein